MTNTTIAQRPTYPTQPGQYRRDSKEIDFREAVFIGPDFGVSVMWRGPSRLTAGYEIRLLIGGDIALIADGSTLRSAFKAFRREALAIGRGANAHYAQNGRFSLAEISAACQKAVCHP